jgi:TolB-like protein
MRYLFEGYVLDTDRRELCNGPDLVPLEPQVFDLLAYLIENRERVVTKDDLLAAVWEGRNVSESSMTSRINAARTAIGDTGEHQRLIKTLLRKGFRFVAAVSEEKRKPEPAAGATADNLALPDKPSIAVLPFANMSGDSEQEYFADGMVEEIITALSHLRWLFVIARNSSFAYKGRHVDVKQIGRELGVRYVLEGSVRKAASRVRITGQLVDASTGAHLWADRFDGMLEDVFDLQDQVTANVIGAIAPKLEYAEIERAKRKPTESLDAYDYFLRGMASVHAGTREANFEALKMFYKAIDLDRSFASAHGIAAWCYAWRKWDGFVADRAVEQAEAARLARRAAELDSDDAVALCAGGYALAFAVHDLDDGAAYIERALALNPNLAMAWHSSGWVKVFLGEPDLAVEHLQHAMRLSPLDRLIFRAYGGSAYAHLFAGRYNEACAWAEKAFRARPTYLPAVRAAAASHALAGRQEEAEKAMAYLRPLDPTLRIAGLKDLLPLRRAGDVQRLAEGLRQAGLPE